MAEKAHSTLVPAGRVEPVHPRRRSLFAAAAALPLAALAVPAFAAPSCPAAQLWSEMLEAIVAKRAAEDARTAALWTAAYPDAARRDDAALERIWSLEKLISAVQATSLPGAMAQIVVASAALDCVLDCSGDDAMQMRLHAQARHLLYSARAVFQAATGQTDEALAGRYFMPPDLNPFLRGDAGA